LIPNGFNTTEGTYFYEHVIDFNFYMCLKAKKSFPPGFDFFSMFRWMSLVSQNEKKTFKIFYGLDDSEDLSDNYIFDDFYFAREVEFTDGYGLESNAYKFNTNIFITFLLILIYFIF